MGLQRDWTRLLQDHHVPKKIMGETKGTRRSLKKQRPRDLLRKESETIEESLDLILGTFFFDSETKSHTSCYNKAHFKNYLERVLNFCPSEKFQVEIGKKGSWKVTLIGTAPQENRISSSPYLLIVHNVNHSLNIICKGYC